MVYVHCSLGYWSCNYLDDYGSAKLQDEAWASFNLMGRIIERFGVEEATEKVVAPTTRMDFLGNIVDTIKMTIEVSEERREELLQLLHKCMWIERFKKKHLQSLIGKLSFVTNCVRARRIFISRLLDELRGLDEKSWYQVNEEIKKDVIWWIKFLPTSKGEGILWLEDLMPVDALLASDASLIGGGAVHKTEFCHFHFPEEIIQNTDNIAQREMITILVAVKIWAKELKGKVVWFSTDNENAKFAINRGRTRDKFILKCIRKLAWVTAEHQILIKAEYINTKLNLIPDALSRWYQSSEARRTFKCHTNKDWKRRSVNKD